MNYYERYCGDYQRDTAHLSLAEHGAYTMLLDTYFSVEKPLSSDLASLYRVCRAMTRLEQQAVKAVAEQFFPISDLDGLRHNPRADREIAKARPKIEAARINGRKGGRPPKNPEHQARQETFDVPTGFPAGYADTSHDNILQEPDGKAHQRLPQPQHQPQRERAQVNDETDRPPRLRMPIPEEQGSNADPSLPCIPHACASIAQEPESTVDASIAIPTGVAGTYCKALMRHGVHGCNPHHPTFLALLEAGATEEEFMQAARNALARGKASFAYVVGTVKRQREEAAKLVLHRGRLPNRQEMLESCNRAAAQGWLPPELRRARSSATGPEEVMAIEGLHAN
jgi:uncharacterized protein YdaU (DUF1376 family)